MGTLILADALSGIANNRDYAPRLVWSNRFDGTISYPDPPDKGVDTTRFYYKNQSGVDSLGFGLSHLTAAINGGPGTLDRREIIIVIGNPGVSPFYGDVITNSSADIPAVFDYSIVTNDLKGGRGNKIVMTQKNGRNRTGGHTIARRRCGTITFTATIGLRAQCLRFCTNSR